MKKYLLATLVASAAMFGLSSAQAAPLTSSYTTLQAQAASGDTVQKVWHCRRWSGGWGCGGGHWRWGSRRRWWR